VVENMNDFRALNPFFRIIEEGLEGLVDGDHFFDLLDEDVPSASRCRTTVTTEVGRVGRCRGNGCPAR
jgi:hypothetical protein